MSGAQATRPLLHPLAPPPSPPHHHRHGRHPLPCCRQGHTARDIQSGRGVVHNGCLYKRVQRSVMRGTWLFPGYIPFYLHDSANGQALCHAAAKFFACPSFYNFVVCALNALLTG